MKKPKVAICFAGLPSFIDHNKGYWQEVIDRYDADIYASLWSDEEKLYNDNDTIDNFVDSYKPIKLELENYKDVQNNTFRYLAEDVINYKEKDKTWQDTQFGLIYERFYDKEEECALVGRNFSKPYKAWKANLLKDSLDKKYDIVVSAETCSSYPDLSLDRVDDYSRADKCISMPYFFEKINLSFWSLGGIEKPVLNPWVVFGPADLMDYYCSMFLYLKKYSSEVIFSPPNSIAVHHLLNRPSILLRLFFSKIFRKSILSWNGMHNCYDAYETTGKEEPEIDKNSFYITMGNFHNAFLTKDSFPVKAEYENISNINRVTWLSNRPPKQELKSEKTYVKLDSEKAGTMRSRMERSAYNDLPNFNLEIAEDKYGNLYPKYTKKNKTPEKQQGLSLAHYISEKLNSQGVKIWLTYGSSLGAVREGKMIEGDETDLDMMMWEEDKSKLIKVFKNSPYRVSWDFRHFNNGGEICKLTLGEKMLPKVYNRIDGTDLEEGKHYCISCFVEIPDDNLTVCRVCEEYGNQFHIDISFLKRTSDNIRCYDSCYPKTYLKSYHYDNLRKIKFENLDFYVSKYAEDTLDFFYNGIDGTDNTWRVPIKRDIYYSKGYDCSKFSRGKEGTLTCYVEGVFDLFHKGHVRLLKRASKIFDKVVAGITPDEITATYKDNLPIIPFEDRKGMLESCKYVNKVIKGSPTLVPTVSWIEQNNIDYIVAGRNKHNPMDEWYEEIIKENRLFLLDETPDYHTTDLIKKISA